MRGRLGSLLVLAALLAAFAVVEWRAAAAPAALAESFSRSLFVLSQLVVSVDLFDLLMRVYLRRVHTLPMKRGRVAPVSIPIDLGAFSPYQMRLHLRPYALLVSVHNLGADVEPFLEAMAPYRERLWVIDDASTDDTFARFQAASVRIFRASRNLRKPGAIRELLGHLPPEIATVIVLDPDARIRPGPAAAISDLERVIFEFQRSRKAALCPRLAVCEDGTLASFQAFEYWVAFALGRKSLADHSITSGIAVYRRDALARALASHTLSVYAEDLKNTLILIGQGEGIYYDGRLVVETEGKRTWRAWFSQRVGWYYGLLKVYTENFRDVLASADRRLFFIYNFLVYIGLFTLLLHPLKLAALGILALSALNGLDNAAGTGLVPDSAATEPLYFLLGWLRCTFLALLLLPLAVGRGERLRMARVAPFYYFYALAHLVPITVGYLNWFTLRLFHRRIYRDHYQDEGSLGRENGRHAA